MPDVFSLTSLTQVISDTLASVPLEAPWTPEQLVSMSDSVTAPTALFERDWLGPVAGSIALVQSSTIDWRGSARKTPVSPTPLGRYDPDASLKYFAAHPRKVIARLAEGAIPTLRFGAALLMDELKGNEQGAEAQRRQHLRAQQLVELLTELGPTFIKAGQALSIRADLISAAYIAALSELQDRVPPFSSYEARQIMEREWGRPVSEIFSSLSNEPVAAASLGQVYRGTLKESGVEVAVKVQRPDTLERISLDLLILRFLAERIKKWQNLNSDLAALVDDWGRGFIDELDYTREADNQRAFIASIQDTPLRDVVTAPEVVTALSTDCVLTTEWVIGERLEKSQATDVSKLCGIALNTYLTMLLSTGLLHCDPHPGNLLRTVDGRLCILDWGLVTEVDEDLQLTFLEHVAHLVAKDYAAVPADLVKLGFVPEGKEQAIMDGDVVETLASVYTQWAGGGGAAKIDVNEVSGRLRKLTEERGNFFQIPPYFAYILRAFSVLEGIALINDPNYSILEECLPYIAQRVLTDSSPRSKSALRTFIYTANEQPGISSGPLMVNDATSVATLPKTEVIDAIRLKRLADGLTSFSESSGGLALDDDAKLQRLVEQVVSLVLARDGSPVQHLLLDETTRLLDAVTRDAASRALGLAPSGEDLPLALRPLQWTRRAVDPTGLLSAYLVKSEEDEAVLAAAQALVSALQQISDQQSSDQETSNRLARLIADEMWKRREELPVLSLRLAARSLLRASDRFEQTSSSLIAAAEAREAAERTSSGARSEDELSSSFIRFTSSFLRGGLAVASSGLVAAASDPEQGVRGEPSATVNSS